MQLNDLFACFLRPYHSWCPSKSFLRRGHPSRIASGFVLCEQLNTAQLGNKGVFLVPLVPGEGVFMAWLAATIVGRARGTEVLDLISKQVAEKTGKHWGTLLRAIHDRRVSGFPAVASWADRSENQLCQYGSEVTEIRTSIVEHGVGFLDAERNHARLVSLFWMGDQRLEILVGWRESSWLRPNSGWIPDGRWSDSFASKSGGGGFRSFSGVV